MPHHPHDIESKLLDDFAYGVQNDLYQDEFGRRVITAYEAGVRDEVIVGDIHLRAERHRSHVLLGDAIPFRLPRCNHGELNLGADTSGALITFLLIWLNAGLLICGNTGAGKSALIKHLVSQVAQYVPVWLSDMYKQEMRHLRALLRPAVDFAVVTVPSMKVNLLQADGDPRTHLAMVLDILRRVLDLPGRAMSIVKSVCHSLYIHFGVYLGNPKAWPTLFDVYEHVWSAAGLNPAAREAILDRLGALLTSLTPGVAANRVSWRPSDLTRYHLIFEMGSATEHVKSAVLNYLLFSVLYGRIERSIANSPLNLVVAFEDAQKFFDDGAADREMTPITEVAGLIRGCGVSLWCSCQSMSGLSRGLIPNLASRIMGRMGTHQDYQQLGADMGMNAEQIGWAKLNLQAGRFVGQFAEGPWRHPFVARIKGMNVPPVVDDQEVDASIAALRALPTVPADEFQNWQPRHLIELSSLEQNAQENLSEAHEHFLAVVIENPGMKVSAIAKIAGLSGKRAAEIRRDLVQAGYLREHQVATAGRGRNAIVLEPLPAALGVIDRRIP